MTLYEKLVKYLTKKEFSNFEKNIIRDGSFSSTVDYCKFMEKVMKPDSNADIIGRAFIWQLTEEGQNYWSLVSDKFKILSVEEVVEEEPSKGTTLDELKLLLGSDAWNKFKKNFENDVLRRGGNETVEQWVNKFRCVDKFLLPMAFSFSDSNEGQEYWMNWVGKIDLYLDRKYKKKEVNEPEKDKVKELLTKVNVMAQNPAVRRRLLKGLAETINFYL